MIEVACNLAVKNLQLGREFQVVGDVLARADIQALIDV